jgi:hypothetical protein
MTVLFGSTILIASTMPLSHMRIDRAQGEIGGVFMQNEHEDNRGTSKVISIQKSLITSLNNRFACSRI